MDWEIIEYSVSLLGVASFAITAILIIAPRGLDIFQATVMGLISSIGGGTLRDIIINAPVFWLKDVNYIIVGLLASIFAFVGYSFINKKNIYRIFLYLDSLGMAIFAIESVIKVWKLDIGIPIVPIVMGMVTAIANGILRDIVAGRKALILTRQLFALPVLLGCSAIAIVLLYYPGYLNSMSMFCVLIIFITRSAAIFWNITVPEWIKIKPHN